MGELIISSMCTGIGSFEMAMRNLKIPHISRFAIEIDKYAKQTFLANFETETMYDDMTTYDYIGDKWYSDLLVAGIPCQAFSLAGKRLGELDARGLLFYDFYRYVKNQQPKYFIIENVKGLLSMDKGNVFNNWKALLGQSENGNMFLHTHEDSLMYNLHWKVLNTKNFGLPQNRERVFLVGIRNDLPNDFVFPKEIPLELRLKDLLEEEVDEKYYLSERIIDFYIKNSENNKLKGNGFRFNPTDGNVIGKAITTMSGSRMDDNYIKCSDDYNQKVYRDDIIQINPSTESGGKQPYQQNRVYDSDGIAPALCRGKSDLNITEKSNHNKLKQIGSIYDSNSVGGRIYDSNNISCTLTSQGGGLGAKTGLYEINYKIRKLTPLECFRLQGFPDDFVKPVSSSQLYKQAGNSISVPVVENILKILLKKYIN